MKFLKTYPPGKHYLFPTVTFRHGEPVTTWFGLDETFGRLRIHNAIDRGAGEIFCPFDMRKIEYNDQLEKQHKGFGSILRLWPKDADFELRIMHIENNTLYTKTGEIPVAGAHIGMAGNLGTSTGRHTHTEIVSLKTDSKICETILHEKHPLRIRLDFDEQDIMEWIKKHDLPRIEMQSYLNIRKHRGITVLNNYLCRRTDYLDGKNKTFYNSLEVFNI